MNWIKTLWNKIIGWFRKEPSDTHHQTLLSDGASYEVVEAQFDEEESLYRQGFKIISGKYDGIVFTVSPKVGIDEDKDGNIHLRYDVIVESNPNQIEYVYADLHRYVGTIVVDLLTKEYA